MRIEPRSGPRVETIITRIRVRVAVRVGVRVRVGVKVRVRVRGQFMSNEPVVQSAQGI